MSQQELSYEDFFPYASKRAGQADMMNRIEDCVRAGTNILCEAPNGFGKTCATLCAILPWAQKHRGKVLYCARTHRQLDRVVEELGQIEKTKNVSGLSFRGRSHMCINKFVLDNADMIVSVSEMCQQLKADGKCAFYEKTRKLGDPEVLLTDMPKKILTAPEIAMIARKRGLCPYELAKRLARAVDVIALSYLYVFDPSIRETFIPELDFPMSRAVLVQDEAHNVPSTALDSASEKLTLGTIRQAMREGRTYNDQVTYDFCRALAQSIIDISAGISNNDEMIVNSVGIYEKAVEESGIGDATHPLTHMNELGANIRKNQLRHGKPPRSAIYRVADFMINWLDHSDRNDYAFVLSSELRRSQSRRIALERVALDPTAVTIPLLRFLRCSVAVSGTASPLSAYAEMLGFCEDSAQVSFRSPFSDQTRIGVVVEGVDTSYNARSDEMFTRMVEHCAVVVEGTPGNTGIFTTSYGIAAALRKAGLERRVSKKLFLEKQGAAGKENDKMIEEFKLQGQSGGAVLLGVQGGRNSEGGDFPGPTMESVVVVGVPYARPTPRTEALISYYDTRFNGRGRDYAYVLPAMTRSIQTAGRPVRRLDDRGVIVLLDQRFNTPYLKRFMPPWLGEIVHSIPDSPAMLSSIVTEFFRGAHEE